MDSGTRWRDVLINYFDSLSLQEKTTTTNEPRT